MPGQTIEDASLLRSILSMCPGSRLLISYKLILHSKNENVRDKKTGFSVRYFYSFLYLFSFLVFSYVSWLGMWVSVMTDE